MEIIVLLLSVVNILLAFFVLFGGRYIFRRLDTLEEAVHQMEIKSLGSAAKQSTEDVKTISDTGWE